MRRIPVREGRPFPLGATWDGLGVNFALFSANAQRVELCLFDNDGKTELERARAIAGHCARRRFLCTSAHQQPSSLTTTP